MDKGKEKKRWSGDIYIVGWFLKLPLLPYNEELWTQQKARCDLLTSFILYSHSQKKKTTIKIGQEYINNTLNIHFLIIYYYYS